MSEIPEGYIIVPASAWHELVQYELKCQELVATVEALKSEILGLVSTVFKTSKALIEATETLERELLPALEDSEPLIELIEEFKSVIAATPQQHFAEIRVQAAEKFYYMGWEHSLSTKSDDGDHYGCGKRLAKSFADSIRRGEVM